MAEAVVGVLIGKLTAALAIEAATYGASLLGKEASALKGLFGEIRKAEAELEIMRAYLRDSEKFKDANETTSIFVRRVRDLAFRTEDVVDEFTYRLEDCKHGILATRIKKWIKHAMIWRRLALKLRNINAELEDAAKKRELYVTPQVLERSANQTLSFAREEDLVGIEDNVVKLTQWLVGDLEGRHRKIVTVWGMGGVGKTTLVERVYKIVKEDFDTTAWVTVSKTYQVEDL
jgi:disease resistance protein RPM1